jgi:ATP-dependent Clp protease ATP-binding subunit ClpA
MRFDKFTTKFQQAVSDAQSLAVGNDQQFIEPQHLLLALLNQDDGSTTSLLQRAGANVGGLKAALGKAWSACPRSKATAARSASAATWPTCSTSPTRKRRRPATSSSPRRCSCWP